MLNTSLRIADRENLNYRAPHWFSVSVLPEILEPIRRHLGVSNRVHDIFMPQVVLEGPSIMPIVGQLVASGVPEHVRMDREPKLSRLPGPGDRFKESRSRGGTTASR